MLKYKIIGAITLFFAILSTVVLALGPRWQDTTVVTARTIAADIGLWVSGICIALGVILLLCMKIYEFIKYTVLKKPRKDDIHPPEYSYRSKFDE